MNIKKKTFSYFLIFFFWIFLLEITSFGIISLVQIKFNTLYFDHAKIKFKPNNFNLNYSKYLGWLSPYENRDMHGARIDNNIYANNCIDMFGDSFTYSLNVDNENAWPKKLSEYLKCRVFNFGVSAYGSDQATMRHQIVKSNSNVAVLNHLSENIIRNVNQLRNFIYPNEQLKFKPRFIFNKYDELVYLPISDIDLENLLSKQYIYEKFPFDFFIPGGSSGINMLEDFSFPYTIELIKIISNHWHVKSKIKNEPRHMQFYNRAHPSNALKITISIFKRFINQAKMKNQKGIVTIIPTCLDLEYFKKNNTLPYQSLIDELLKNDIVFFDFSNSFLSTKNFYDYFGKCNEHPNILGYELMAKSFSEFIINNNLISFESN